MKRFMLRRMGMSDDPSGSRPSLQDCLEAVLSHADTLISDVLDGLVAASVKIKGKSSYGDYLVVDKAVADWLCAQAPEVKKTFAAQLRQGVYNSGSAELSETPQVRFDDLQLLDRKQIDASIEFAIAQQEVARSVEEILPSLNALMSSLMGWMTVQPQLNPLKPDVFVRALQSCLLQHVPDEGPRAALITPAAGLLGVSLRQLYREICDWLRSHGVEPATPVGAPLGGRGAPGAKEQDNSVTRTMVTLDKLRKLLSGEFDVAPVMRDFLQTLPASYVALEDMKLVEPMMKRLTQRANQPIDITQAPSASMHGIAREKTQGKQLGKQLGEEVVRLMLDNLMQDTRLLLKVRELIQSLEPALLDLSRTDARFFSDRQHPARQFLDRVTHRSLGFAAESDEGFSRFRKSIATAAAHLIQGEHDAAAFANCLHGLEEGWAADEAVQRQQHEEAARALLRAEQRNLLAQRLAEDFQERAKHKDVPELVVGFLRGPWAQVVAQSQLTCSEGSDDPEGYLALVDDLIWSVQVRLARRNRVKLVQLVPGLLGKLRQGLNSIQYPSERIPVFFDALIALHEKAFEGHRTAPPAADASLALAPAQTDLTAEEEAKTAQANADADDVSPASDFWVGEDEANESGYLADAAEPLSQGTARTLSVADLNTGVWVELLVEGVWLRAQLTWTSPHRTLFMFISHGGLAHSMSRRTMDRLLMQGSIKFLSDGHLVDNALDAVAKTALQNDVGQMVKKP